MVLFNPLCESAASLSIRRDSEFPSTTWNQAEESGLLSVFGVIFGLRQIHSFSDGKALENLETFAITKLMSNDGSRVSHRARLHTRISQGRCKR